jgi:hypothetical protein
MMATQHVLAPSENPYVDCMLSTTPVGLSNNAWGAPMGCLWERRGEFPLSHPVKCVTEEAQIETVWPNKKKSLGIFLPCKF